MIDLWAECKIIFYEAELDNPEQDYSIFCHANALAHPKSKTDTFASINLPLVNFLINAREEGYNVNVFASSPDVSSTILENNGIDLTSIPFTIESNMSLLNKYSGQQKGLLIADDISSRKADQPLVYWNQHDQQIKKFLAHFYGHNAINTMPPPEIG